MNESFNIDDKERALLSDILDSRMGELREQIYKAEAPAFRDELKDEEIVLKSLIDKVQNGQSPIGKLS